MKYFIVGLGMIGSSYAKILSSLNYDVYGCDIDQETNLKALKLGYIKDYGLKHIKDSDLVILTLYPHLNYEFIKDNIKHFKNVKLVTDVAGVKKNYLKKIKNILPKTINYLSHHPMAGSEKSGIDASSSEVFKEANFLIVANSKPKEKSLKLLLKLKSDLGFKNVSIIDEETHDLLIGFTSQLPHMMAVALVNSDIYETTKDFSGDSYKDLTRIANINDLLWSELFFSNKNNLINEMKRFKKEFEKLLKLLTENNKEELKNKLTQAKEKRRTYND